MMAPTTPWTYDLIIEQILKLTEQQVQSHGFTHPIRCARLNYVIFQDEDAGEFKIDEARMKIEVMKNLKTWMEVPGQAPVTHVYMDDLGAVVLQYKSSLSVPPGRKFPE